MSQLNSISSLTKLNFSLLSLEQKIAIKKEGRPKPNLIIVKESKCGCDITNKLFCFPCYY